MHIYATKPHLNSGTDVNTSKKLKSDIDDSDIDKLKTVLVNLIKLSDVVKNEVIKKADIMNLLKKIMLIRLLILAI